MHERIRTIVHLSRNCPFDPTCEIVCLDMLDPVIAVIFLPSLLAPTASLRLPIVCIHPQHTVIDRTMNGQECSPPGVHKYDMIGWLTGNQRYSYTFPRLPDYNLTQGPSSTHRNHLRCFHPIVVAQPVRFFLFLPAKYFDIDKSSLISNCVADAPPLSTFVHVVIADAPIVAVDKHVHPGARIHCVPPNHLPLPNLLCFVIVCVHSLRCRPHKTAVSRRLAVNSSFASR